ncbi:MAG: helix-turn-helix transcriptional regulator [Bacilli bacterium]|nr:helix-turn-helix transcriptional regulator [Bacilli bacterium]
MMTINKQLGYLIRYLREEKGLTIEQLALEAEVNRNYLGDLERGTRNPTILVLSKIAKGLGITLSNLFENIKEM